MQLVAQQQRADINPDAIFGMIDPRTTKGMQLQELFASAQPQALGVNQSRIQKIGQRKNSNQAAWNDTSEFATPNLLMKAEKENYLISHNNVQDISSFNPFDVRAKKQISNTKIKPPTQSIGLNSGVNNVSNLSQTVSRMKGLKPLYPNKN